MPQQTDQKHSDQTIVGARAVSVGLTRRHLELLRDLARERLNEIKDKEAQEFVDLVGSVSADSRYGGLLMLAASVDMIFEGNEDKDQFYLSTRG